MVRRNRDLLVERERRQEAQEYEKELKQKQEIADRARQKPISVRSERGENLIMTRNDS